MYIKLSDGTTARLLGTFKTNGRTYHKLKIEKPSICSWYKVGETVSIPEQEIRKEDILF